MNGNLQFDFLVDKKNNIITVRREFLAERQLVWDCYTKSELLEQWFAPKPLTAKTKSMNFIEGGYWHYVMVEPNGIEHWSITEYLEIRPTNYFTTSDAFCNEKGEINPKYPRAKGKITFVDKGKITITETVITYSSLADVEAVIQMGMKDGLTSTLERLDDLLINYRQSN